MTILDRTFLTALAALVSAIASLIWALRRHSGKE